MNGVTLESCQSIIEQFEPCLENKSKGVLGIDGEWVFPSVRPSQGGDGKLPGSCMLGQGTLPVGQIAMSDGE